MIRFLMLIALGLTSWACGHEASSNVIDARLNVVIVSIDTLRADHVSAYGYARSTTPNVDAIAADGVLFEQAYSQSPHTAPSHMTLFTGLLPEAHGVANLALEGNARLSESIPTLATLLHDRGWRTAAWTGGGNVKGAQGFDQGFEVFHETPNTPRAMEEIFSGAVRLVNELADEPFLLFVHTYEVHDPYTPPDGYGRLWIDPEYKGTMLSTPEALDEGDDPWLLRHMRFWESVDEASPADVQRLQDLYDGSVRYTDEQVGRLVEALKRNGVWDRTLFVFLSDHGEEFGEHGGFLHGTVYQECLRVPLIMHVPSSGDGEADGRRVPGVVGLVDVLPTLLERLGLPVPEHVQGRSLVAAMQAPGGDAAVTTAPAAGDEPEPVVLSEIPGQGVHALRQGRWKLVVHAAESDGPRLSLFDLEADPGEQHDVASRHPDVVTHLVAAFDRSRRESAERRDRFEAGGEVPLDDEMLEHLQALGYLTGER